MTDFWTTGYIKEDFETNMFEGILVVAGSVKAYENGIYRSVPSSSVIVHPGHIIKPKKMIDINEFCAQGICFKKGLLRNTAYGMWSKNLKYKFLLTCIIFYIKLILLN